MVCLIACVFSLLTGNAVPCAGGEGADGSWEVEFAAARAAAGPGFGDEDDDFGAAGAGGGGDGEDGAEGARRHALGKADPVRSMPLKEHVQGASFLSCFAVFTTGNVGL